MAQAISNDSGLDVSPEDIEFGKNSKNTSKKRGGPYSKHDKEKRIEEIHKLHFDYGYSAREIADMMKINRNTINHDITELYGQVYDITDKFNLEFDIMISLNRLEFQRDRLRKRLDKVENFQQQQQIERMLFDVESKLINSRMKFTYSQHRIDKYQTDFLNRHLERKGDQTRYMNFSDRISVSNDAYEKITKIIKEDKIKTKT